MYQYIKITRLQLVKLDRGTSQKMYLEIRMFMIKWSKCTMQRFVVLINWMFQRFLFLLHSFNCNLDIS